MNKKHLHIVTIALLFLILIYSTPISWLHNCSRLNVHNNSVVIEEAHGECYLCDLQLTSFISPTILAIQAIVLLISAFFSFYLLSSHFNFKKQLSNKGPPLVVLV